MFFYPEFDSMFGPNYIKLETRSHICHSCPDRRDLVYPVTGSCYACEVFTGLSPWRHCCWMGPRCAIRIVWSPASSLLDQTAMEVLARAMVFRRVAPPLSSFLCGEVSQKGVSGLILLSLVISRQTVALTNSLLLVFTKSHFEILRLADNL